MKKPPKRAGNFSGPANRNVAVLVYDGLCTFEYGIAVEMFGIARPELERWYRFASCAVDRGAMRAAKHPLHTRARTTLSRFLPAKRENGAPGGARGLRGPS